MDKRKIVNTEAAAQLPVQIIVHTTEHRIDNTEVLEIIVPTIDNIVLMDLLITDNITVRHHQEVIRQDHLVLVEAIAAEVLVVDHHLEAIEDNLI